MTTNHLAFSTTSESDPLSKYSVWQNARDVRETWMRMMGMDDDEIALECQADPPHDLDEELEQYNAMFDIERLNAQR